jgi:hypothetical protein
MAGLAVAMASGVAAAAAGGDTDQELTGATHDGAVAAALTATGGGTVLETEAGDDGPRAARRPARDRPRYGSGGGRVRLGRRGGASLRAIRARHRQARDTRAAVAAFRALRDTLDQV